MGKPLHRRTIPAAFTLLLYEHLASCGHAPEAVLGLPWPSADPEEKDSIDVARWESMLDKAQRLLDDPLLGLSLGRTVTARHLGVVGHLLLACENFGAVLQRLEHYQRLIFDVVPMVRRQGRGHVDMVWDISEFRTTPLVGETGFAVMVQFCRNLMVGDANPLAVDFAHPPPADIRPYEAFFRCPVRFGRPEPLIRAGDELLARPLKRPDTALEQLLEQHAERLLAMLPQQDEVVVQVRKAVTALLPNGDPDIDRVSTVLFRSSRTLQRRLKDAGTSFRREVNLVRNELAKSYLEDPRMPVADIAALLGYSEQSAFSRAFKAQNGQSPRQRRAELLASRRPH